jgi:uracil-DNA glycosylase family 4
MGPMSDNTRDQSLAALRWLMDAGADEAVSETPVNRFTQGQRAAVPPPSTVAKAPVEAPRREVRVTKPEIRTATSSAQAVSLSTAPGAARALAQSCTTLAELRTAVTNFEGCELKRSATNTVFADGDPSGRIMLIGEAPGRDEDLQGLPFVGRAGKLLDRMLAEIGLDRRKVYITNVLNWRPPQNREPSPEEAATCLPFLHRHIELADPKLMILLGAVSVRHVLGLTEGITRVRGKWNLYQSVMLNRSIPVMPTLHPAYLLRQPAAKRLAWRDLVAVAEKMGELGLA